MLEPINNCDIHKSTTRVRQLHRHQVQYNALPPRNFSNPHNCPRNTPSNYNYHQCADKSIGDTSDIISDSSGVGTNSDSAACSIGHPSTTVVCMQPYTGTSLGHLSIQPGDVIDVVGSTDCGLLEGFVRGVNRSGFFPEHCVQEVNIRQKNIHNVSTAATSASTATTAAAVGEYRGTVMMQPQQQQPNQHQPSYSSATAPRIKKGYAH